MEIQSYFKYLQEKTTEMISPDHQNIMYNPFGQPIVSQLPEVINFQRIRVLGSVTIKLFTNSVKLSSVDLQDTTRVLADLATAILGST